MPRSTAKRMKGQQQVNPQDTFDFTVPERRGSARPVDAYAAPGADSGLTNVLSFMKSFDLMSQSTLRAFQIHNAERREQGTMAAARGEQAGGNEGWAWIEGYEEFNGQAAVADYKADMEQLYQTSWDLSPEDWAAQKEAITQKYINGSSDAFLRGFIQQAPGVEDRFDERYRQANLGKLQENFLADTAKQVSLVLEDENASLKIQKLKDGLFKRGKDIGLDRNAISAAVWDTAVESALKTGDTRKLSFVFDEDTHGVRMKDLPQLREKIASDIRAVERRKEAIAAEIEAQRRKALEKMEDDIDRAIVLGMDEGSYDQADMLAREAANQGLIDGKRLEDILKDIHKVRLNEGFAEVSNPDVYEALYDAALDGELDSEILRDNRIMLSKNDWVQLTKLRSKNRHNQSKKDFYSAKEQVNEAKRLLAGELAPIDKKTGAYLGDNGGARVQFINQRFNRLYHQWVSNNDPATITPDIVEKWASVVKEQTEATHPADILTSSIRSKGRPAENRPKSPGQRAITRATMPQEEQQTLVEEDLSILDYITE